MIISYQILLKGFILLFLNNIADRAQICISISMVELQTREENNIRFCDGIALFVILKFYWHLFALPYLIRK